MDSNYPPEEQSSFGIKKIVDCKVENGRQMFKVKWAPTWEPAENLAGCQHLINKFWSHVNSVKSSEERSIEHYRMKLNPNIPNIEMLSQENKADIQRLIARTNATTTSGNHSVLSPSNMLSSQQNNFMGGGMNHPPSIKQEQSNHNISGVGFPQQQQQQNKLNNMKVENNESLLDVKSGKAALNNASLKYLENFNNPYVKIVIVCKICNKEQPSKFAGNWRQHYMTHSDKKPHQCAHCPKGFIRADQLRKHVQAKHGGASTDNTPPPGNSTMQGNHTSPGTPLNLPGMMQMKEETHSPYIKSENYF